MFLLCYYKHYFVYYYNYVQISFSTKSFPSELNVRPRTWLLVERCELLLFHEKKMKKSRSQVKSNNINKVYSHSTYYYKTHGTKTYPSEVHTV